MTSVNNKSKSVWAAVVSVVFTALMYFYYYIDAYLSGWVVFAAVILTTLCAILIVVGIVRQLVRIFKNRSTLNFSYFLPIVIYVTFLFLPIGEVEDRLSPVKLRACYEGTQSQTVIYFHADSSFRLHATGVFGYSKWTMGKWQQKHDTLLLNWAGAVHRHLGRNLLIDSGYLRPLDASVPEPIRKQPLFYLGYCKGEN